MSGPPSRGETQERTHQGLEGRVVLQVIVQVSVGHYPVHLDAGRRTDTANINRPACLPARGLSENFEAPRLGARTTESRDTVAAKT